MGVWSDSVRGRVRQCWGGVRQCKGWSQTVLGVWSASGQSVFGVWPVSVGGGVNRCLGVWPDSVLACSPPRLPEVSGGNVSKAGKEAGELVHLCLHHSPP